MSKLHWGPSKCGIAFRTKKGQKKRRKSSHVTYDPSKKITCHTCLRSNKYEQDMAVFQIGYDGDARAFMEAFNYMSLRSTEGGLSE